MYEYTIAETKSGWMLTVLKPFQEKPAAYCFDTKPEVFVKLAQITLETLSKES